MKDPVRDALDFSNFVCLALCQQYASFSKTRLFGTEEDELAVFAGSDVDLVAYKGTHIPVFPDTTDVDSLTLTVSRPLLLFFVFRVPTFHFGNYKLGLGLLVLLGILGLGQGLERFAVVVRSSFTHLRGNQAWDAACIPSKMATDNTYQWFCVLLSHMFGARFDQSAVLPGIHLSLRCKGNLVFLLRLQPLVGLQRNVATRQWRFKFGAFLLLDGLPCPVTKPHVPIMQKEYSLAE